MNHIRYMCKYDHLDGMHITDTNHDEVYQFLCDHVEDNQLIEKIELVDDNFIKMRVAIYSNKGMTDIDLYNDTHVIAVPDDSIFPFFILDYRTVANFLKVFEEII